MFKNKKKDFTEEWKLYEKGKEYNRALGLYETVNENERFYRGDQWDGVDSGGLPTPVFNIFKRIINYFVSAVLQNAVKMRFSVNSPYGESTLMSSETAKSAEKKLNSIFDSRWESLKMDKLLADAMTDSAVTGDAVCYTYWDPKIKTGQAFTGDFVTVAVDNTNVFFGDPNSKKVETQPYILISQRETVESLKKQAKENKRPIEEIERISADDDRLYEAGDLSQKELDDTKCVSLILLRRGENGNIIYRKSVKNAVIKDETDTGLTRYPIAFFNWSPNKNCWHGTAAATGLAENQLFINKAFAMVMKHMMDTAFSKVVYDSTVIEEWSNRVGEAVAVTGPVESVAKVLPSGQLQSGMLDVINMAISNTKEFLGATDTALGDVTPTNTSAILALQQSANVPLDNVRRALYGFVEDIGLIWLDFMFAYYDDKRLVSGVDNGVVSFARFDMSAYRNTLFGCRVDVGASSYWSEITAINTLDKLLSLDKITLTQYLERIPEGIIPKKDELIEETKGMTIDETGKQRSSVGNAV